jgi:hypothetical protein
LTALDQLLQIDRDRPLGKVTRVSDRTRSGFSGGLHDAAENLLAKALRDIRAGDRERAEAYVRRAVRLPFDDHEGVQPGWELAQMLMFTTITDALEECELDDVGWLDAALTTLEISGEHGRAAIRHVLVVVDHGWRLSSRESRRVRQAVDGLVWQPGQEPAAPEPETERISAILEILDSVAAYQG